jgi:cytochrome oxidase assembly protein ShyY1
MDADRNRLLHLELYTQEDTEVEVVLLGITPEGTKSYTAKVQLQDTKGLFMGTRLKLIDFKDEHFMPLMKWYGVKSLSIRGKNIIVGNVLFI